MRHLVSFAPPLQLSLDDECACTIYDKKAVSVCKMTNIWKV
jgi:hypothetical protein